MPLSPYQQKANDIITGAIKSAVFIDEKARNFYDPESPGSIPEEALSVDLYKNFKTKKISLDVHKFISADLADENLKNYLFDKRDLVLLDWKLNGVDGEEYSLQLLADIVNRPHIHFCAIYTSEDNKDLDNVFYNILTYFSSRTKDFYDGLRLELDKDEIQPIKDDLDAISLKRFDKDSIKEIMGRLMKENKDLVNKCTAATGIADKKCALIKVANAFNDYWESDTELPCPDVFSFDSKAFVINNTIVTILNKKQNKPEELLEKLSVQIAGSQNSFTQLLGLEMSKIFSENSSFLDSNLLKISQDALLYHREQLKHGTDDLPFDEFIKGVLIEQAGLKLRPAKLSILNSDFLDTLSPAKEFKPQESELINMNVFYNSTKLKNDVNLNFGDVFKDEKNNYYICITALCDCFLPDKIENSFYFAKGSNIAKADALKLGDTAFISYLSDTTVVKWTDVNTLIGDGDKHLHQFSPVYIKPLSFTVTEPKFVENSIELSSLTSKGEIVKIKVTYLTTIKANYAQRIANHAFGHPIRVGVDFAKP
jgi:hypothetical protein